MLGQVPQPASLQSEREQPIAALPRPATLLALHVQALDAQRGAVALQAPLPQSQVQALTEPPERVRP
ncbi:hypothetical protein Sbs19_21100 [Sphingobium sp. BS19]|nr:hypothetical protein Sbs19_21100 [Sphingobium sp. BS19]